MHAQTSCPCRFLEWDSDFFSHRIARVEGSRLASDTVQQIFDWCAQHRIDCLYLRADSNDAETIRVADAMQFQLVDVRLTFERALAIAPPLPASIRSWCEADLATLASIAGVSHSDSRFYFDGHFPRERCDQLYRVWIERSCHGWADAVLVAELEGCPAGYVSCHLETDDTGSIGLIAVAPEHRGAGLGTHLVNAALQFMLGKGRSRAIVVTQGRNVASQRLYQRCGFVTQSVELYYHRWFTPAPEQNVE
jgi:dTDP-4-amino-4,6-dideoxy-D-galactose acyltransferase